MWLSYIFKGCDLTGFADLELKYDYSNKVQVTQPQTSEHKYLEVFSNPELTEVDVWCSER